MTLFKRIMNIFNKEICLEKERVFKDNYELLLKNAELSAHIRVLNKKLGIRQDEVFR
jgi:hypothetical protein